MLAAQHLLRNAGQSRVAAEGTFDAETSAAVLRFQASQGLVRSGVIGGSSWPLLALPVSASAVGEAGQAVRALLSHVHAQTRSEGSTDGSPESISRKPIVTTALWQRLLDAATR